VLRSLAIRIPLMIWNLLLMQREGEMLQPSKSTCLLATRVIGGGLMDLGVWRVELGPQMRITKIGRSGELVPLAGWAAAANTFTKSRTTQLHAGLPRRRLFAFIQMIIYLLSHHNSLLCGIHRFREQVDHMKGAARPRQEKPPTLLEDSLLPRLAS
jgi:hypothetical protein